MSIPTFQITPAGAVPVKNRAKTLDELTRTLPQGFYTTFSTLSQGTRVLGLNVHLQRLYGPAAEHSLQPSVAVDYLRKTIAALVKKNLPMESRVRLILTRDAGQIFVSVLPFEPISEQVYRDGVRVVTAGIFRQSPRVKDTGFISESVEQRRQVGQDAFEVLLVKNGFVLEGMTSNFYAVSGGRLITARRGILLGVTRRVVLRLAGGLGMPIEYRAPALVEKMSEAFLTSSSRGVVPIVSIDDQPVGRGKVGPWAGRLSKAYKAYVDQASEIISA